MPIEDTHLADADAETFPEQELEENQDPSEFTPVAEDIEVELEGGEDLRIKMSNWDKTTFEKATNAADTERLRSTWEEIREKLNKQVRAIVDLTKYDDKIRGFGGGMLTVVEDEDSIKLHGPRRDFGPIPYKGVFDISAERTQAADGLKGWLDSAREELGIDEELVEWYEQKEREVDDNRDETWEELIHRAAEEVILTKQEEENILHIPEFGDERIDFMVQKAAIQEFLKAKQGYKSFDMEEKSHLHDMDFRVETYDAETKAPEDAAEIILEDFNGEDVVFKAGIIPEPETSSLEGIKYNIIAREELPGEYVPQDTETAEPGDEYVHLDREAYEIEVTEDGVLVNIYQSGEQKVESATLDDYIREMDEQFAEEVLNRVRSEEQLKRLNNLGDKVFESEEYEELEDAYNSLDEIYESWEESSVKDDYDSIVDLHTDLKRAVELKDDLGEEYAAQHATVKVLRSLEGLVDEYEEYGGQIEEMADSLEDPAPVREDLPWVESHGGQQEGAV